jgi:hypothetical protein
LFSYSKARRKIKIATSTSFGAPKPKKAKVQTRRPKLQSLEQTALVPTIEGVKFIESAKVVPAMAAKAMEEVPAMPAEASADAVKVPETEKTAEEHPKLLSPPVVAELPNLSTTATMTLRKRRITSVLDAVLKLMKTPTPASAEASIKKIGDARKVVTASAASAHVEAGPLGATPVRLMEESLLEKSTSTAPEAPPHGDLEYIVRHASGKQLSSEQIAKVQHYAKDLNYPRGSLAYGGNDEDDFLYCLPDSKEINICHEMMDNMGYPKLEHGLSVITKDQLVDSLAYNSLKVYTFWLRI